MKKRKRKEATYEEAFNRVLKRLERKASRRLDKVAIESRAAATVLVSSVHELLVDAHTAVIEFRDAAAEACAAGVQRLEDATREHEAAVQRVSTQATNQILASQRAIDEQARKLGDEAGRHVAELLAAVDEDVQELRSLARERTKVGLATVEEQLRATLDAAEERSRELMTMAGADQQALHDYVAGAAEAVDQIRSHLATAEDLDQRVDRAAVEARFDDPVHPGTDTDAETHPEDARSDTSDDEDLFGRLAAELRADPEQDDFACGDDPDAQAPTWTSLPVNTIPTISRTDTQVAVLEIGTAQPSPSDPVNVIASWSALAACVQQLARDAANVSLRMELVPAAPQSSGSFLRLTAYDAAGWWEYYDVAASADPDLTVSAVVEIRELREALQALNRFASGDMAQIVLEGDVTIDNYLLLARDPNEVPTLSGDRKPVERVDLHDADASGLIIESQVGRLFVPRDLVGCLKRRSSSFVDLVLVGGLPCLAARVDGSGGSPAGMLVARLQELGEHDTPVESERRIAHENEVTQLVSALSTATTPQELSRILKVGVGYVRRRAAAHPALAKDVILDLIREGTEAMRAAAASNVRIGEKASDLAAADASSLVRATLAANPAITANVLARLAADPVAQVRAHAASNAEITSDLLELLAEDEDSSVRAAVASREAIELDLLRVLARDPDPSVCAAVASNPLCPPDVLRELIGIAPDDVLANPNASKAILVAGSRAADPRLRAAVAGNPATPEKQLHKLAQDEDPRVLRAVADHPETPAGARRRARRALEPSRDVMPDV